MFLIYQKVPSPPLPPFSFSEGPLMPKINVYVCLCAVAHGTVSLPQRSNVGVASLEAVSIEREEEEGWTQTQTNIFCIPSMLGGILQ